MAVALEHMTREADERRDILLKTLQNDREEHLRDCLALVTSGTHLPPRKPLGNLVANLIPSQLEDSAKFWEGRRQRLKDAVQALGLVEVPPPRSHAAAADSGRNTPVTPLRPAATPSKPTAQTKAGTPVQATPGKSATSANRAAPGGKANGPASDSKSVRKGKDQAKQAVTPQGRGPSGRWKRTTT
eukprot:Sspe_Gene.74877::Locus_46793_Transcript_1_1_Confidence_1.000_Length_923::g.74877::m.74877